jgi:alpha-glucoside PTS system EIICB component
LGVFNGSVFVYVISFFILLPTAVASCFVWPHIQNVIIALQGFLTTTGLVGVWIFVFLERALIPFGLHHLLYTPLFFDNVVIPGGIYSAWSNLLPTMAASTEPLKDLAPWACFTSTGWSKIFGCTGIAFAFYSTAKPEKREQLLSLLIPITLTSVVCGVTEPIEYTFLFIAPLLFIVHAFLAACLSTVMNAFGVVVVGGGIIEMSSLNFIPLMKNHAFTYLTALIIGLIFVGIYFLVFRTLILKFDIKTPGREDDDESEIEFKSKKDYLEKKSNSGITDESKGKSKNEILAENIVKLLGGNDNIKDLTNCCTRLRVNVHDSSLVGSDTDFKKIGTSGVSKNGCSMQVIVGLTVPSVREEVEAILQL